jgi:hypothetical protein
VVQKGNSPDNAGSSPDTCVEYLGPIDRSARRFAHACEPLDRLAAARNAALASTEVGASNIRRYLAKRPSSVTIRWLV